MPKNKLWTYAALIVIGILLIAAIRGCQKSKQEVNAKSKIQLIADSALAVLKEYKALSDSSKKQFEDTLNFERGQGLIIAAQKERTEGELLKITQENRALIVKYKMGDYADTATTLVPNEFISDCQGCFTNLESTTSLVERYKNDINNIQANWDKQTTIYQKRFKEIDAEKLGFYNKINSLEKQQKEAADKLEPHGRLYLSWGVLFQPWPKYAGAGLMYQNKRNMILGGMWYYGAQGHMVQTTINFPLSLKFK